jgi:glycosyltransferase involved in cell wall biosynthesis
VLLASGSHAIGVAARAWERRLKRVGVHKPIQMIPVGSNIPLAIMSNEERTRLRQQMLGTSEGLLVVGFGARHDRDIPALLSGLRELKKLGRAKLVWIGGGKPDERHQVNIERAIRMHGLDGRDIDWTGVLPHPQVSRLLAASDLMILPFIDGVSTRRTSAVTALQHGLPLLTTRNACLEPEFVHGKNVYLTPIGDTKALENGLVELAQRPEFRAQLAHGARELYHAHFDWGVIARQVSALAEGDKSPC